MAPDYFISPYLGAGINYTVFYDADAGPDIDSINYDNSWGWALQAGTDIFLYKNFFLNIDLKYIRMETKAEINNSFHARTDIDPLPVTGLAANFSPMPRKAVSSIWGRNRRAKAGRRGGRCCGGSSGWGACVPRRYRVAHASTGGGRPSASNDRRILEPDPQVL